MSACSSSSGFLSRLYGVVMNGNINYKLNLMKFMQGFVDPHRTLTKRSEDPS